jgi:hypothetical protein
MKMAVFWAVAPCSLLEIYRRFGGASYLHHHDLYQQSWITVNYMITNYPLQEISVWDLRHRNSCHLMQHKETLHFFLPNERLEWGNGIGSLARGYFAPKTSMEILERNATKARNSYFDIACQALLNLFPCFTRENRLTALSCAQVYLPCGTVSQAYSLYSFFYSKLRNKQPNINITLILILVPKQQLLMKGNKYKL